MSLLNTLLGSSKKLRELPAELHYGCIFPQFITSQNTGVPQTVCPRAVLPVRTKPQLPKERGFPRSQGREGIITANTERLWLPAPSAQAQLPATNPLCSSQTPSCPTAASHGLCSSKVSGWCNPLPACSFSSPSVGWFPLQEGQAESSRRCLEGREVFQVKNRDGALG